MMLIDDEQLREMLGLERKLFLVLLALPPVAIAVLGCIALLPK